MADFINSLWLSIFTPGPTPPLLLATNISFAALQAVLFALLVATYSVHFLILSVLSGGLWWSINWFASEVRRVKEEEERQKGTSGATQGDEGEEGRQERNEEEREKEGKGEKSKKREGSPVLIMGDEKTPVNPDRTESPTDPTTTNPSSSSKPPSSHPTQLLPSHSQSQSQSQQSQSNNDPNATPTKSTWNTSIAARLAPTSAAEDDGAVRQRGSRRGMLAESTDSVSTDGEWEKV